MSLTRQELGDPAYIKINEDGTAIISDSSGNHVAVYPDGTIHITSASDKVQPRNNCSEIQLGSVQGCILGSEQKPNFDRSTGTISFDSNRCFTYTDAGFNSVETAVRTVPSGKSNDGELKSLIIDFLDKCLCKETILPYKHRVLTDFINDGYLCAEVSKSISKNVKIHHFIYAAYRNGKLTSPEWVGLAKEVDILVPYSAGEYNYNNVHEMIHNWILVDSKVSLRLRATLMDHLNTFLNDSNPNPKRFANKTHKEILLAFILDARGRSRLSGQEYARLQAKLKE